MHLNHSHHASSPPGLKKRAKTLEYMPHWNVSCLRSGIFTSLVHWGNQTLKQWLGLQMQNHHWLNGRKKENCETHSSEDKDKLLTTPLTAWVGRNNPALIPHVAGTLFKLLQAYLCYKSLYTILENRRNRKLLRNVIWYKEEDNHLYTHVIMKKKISRFR